jgi:CheY-like chemotaxis protein
MIERAANRALAMVSLSLDLFRMESGSYVFQPQCIDLTATVQAVMLDLRAHADSKGVRIALRAPEEHVLVAADASLCYCCIANLMKNAVEAASDQSTVTLKLHLGEQAQLSIHNNGAVPEALRDQFFEKYATHGKLDGTGLGTYSSRLMAVAQGGSLVMQTSDHGGTTLTLKLLSFDGSPTTAPMPLTAIGLNLDNTAEPLAKPLITKGALHVLVVDDDPYNRKVLRSQQPHEGVNVVTAINGRDAFERCLAHRPDVIFMDLEMPVMGGIEAMQQIRALQKVRLQLPSVICAFSSDDDAKNQARCLALGFSSCMSKPSTEAKVLELLRRVKQDLAEGQAKLPDIQSMAKHDPRSQEPISVESSLMPEMTNFLASRLQLLAQLQTAANASDRAKIRSLAHKLSGSFAMFGFAWAAEVCKQLELHSASMNRAKLVADVANLTDHLLRVPIHTAANHPVP